MYNVEMRLMHLIGFGLNYTLYIYTLYKLIGADSSAQMKSLFQIIKTSNVIPKISEKYMYIIIMFSELINYLHLSGYILHILHIL
jgi:hypothetical protein